MRPHITGWVNGNLHTPTTETIGIISVPPDVREASGMTEYNPNLDHNRKHHNLASKQGTRKAILRILTCSYTSRACSVDSAALCRTRTVIIVCAGNPWPRQHSNAQTLPHGVLGRSGRSCLPHPPEPAAHPTAHMLSCCNSTGQQLLHGSPPCPHISTRRTARSGTLRASYIPNVIATLPRHPPWRFRDLGRSGGRLPTSTHHSVVQTRPQDAFESV